LVNNGKRSIIHKLLLINTKNEEIAYMVTNTKTLTTLNFTGNQFVEKITAQLINYFVSNENKYPFKTLVIGIFLQILFLNYLGMFPNNDALTSTFIVPFFLAFLFTGVSFLMKYFRYGIQA